MTTDPLSFVPILLFTVVAAALIALWIGAMISIFRCSSAMSGLELLGWCALVVFAQFFGPLIWFF
ncbi:MAG: PLDc N-terminal domain-containing protein, partial [Microcella sp.]|nr:PLDc N-terminal domain-containing protein [Microcella sp.]